MAQGAEDFFKLSKRLKMAGELGMRKELHRGMRGAAKPLIPKVKAAALRTLPRRNGLNERIAGKKYAAQVLTGITTAGVRITGAKVDPRINNEGRVFHPVFGRRPGEIQMVPAAKGYFSDTIADSAPDIRDDLKNVVQGYLDQLGRPL